VLYGFCSKFHNLSSSVGILKIRFKFWLSYTAS